MPIRNYEECKETLQKLDASTLERRIERCQELEVIQSRSTLQKEWDYSGEASASYIDGNYRSAIFCCACTVDQRFRYEYMREPESQYDDIERLTFGQIIALTRGKAVKRLLPFLDQALLLNDIRNTVATHPLFTEMPAESDPDRQLRGKLLLRDITRLMELIERIDPGLRRRIESTELRSEIDNKTYILGEVARQQSDLPFHLEGFWGLIENEVLRFLANRAWHVMKAVSESL